MWLLSSVIIKSSNWKRPKSYYYNEDTFNYNYGQAKASVGNFKDAEEIFLQVQSDKLQNDYAYLSWLARCYIMNGKARLAWELYLKMETSKCLNWHKVITTDCVYIDAYIKVI